MASPAAVLVCVLSLLGHFVRATQAIEFVDIPPVHASANVEAFVVPGGEVIYLVTSSTVFREARAALARGVRHGDPFRKLASIIAHELWHLKHGSDEQGAYEAQLTMLAALGAGPDTPVYQQVTRSMLAVRRARAAATPPLRIACARTPSPGPCPPDGATD